MEVWSCSKMYGTVPYIFTGIIKAGRPVKFLLKLVHEQIKNCSYFWRKKW